MGCRWPPQPPSTYSNPHSGAGATDGRSRSTTSCEETEVSAGTTTHIVDFVFEPAQAQLKVGTTVTWVNEGAAARTSAAYVDGTKHWDSNILDTGQSFAFTSSEPGSFDYLCTLRPNLTASLEVVE